MENCIQIDTFDISLRLSTLSVKSFEEINLQNSTSHTFSKKRNFFFSKLLTKSGKIRIIKLRAFMILRGGFLAELHYGYM